MKLRIKSEISKLAMVPLLLFSHRRWHGGVPNLFFMLWIFFFTWPSKKLPVFAGVIRCPADSVQLERIFFLHNLHPMTAVYTEMRFPDVRLWNCTTQVCFTVCIVVALLFAAALEISVTGGWIISPPGWHTFAATVDYVGKSTPGIVFDEGKGTVVHRGRS